MNTFRYYKPFKFSKKLNDYHIINTILKIKIKYKHKFLKFQYFENLLEIFSIHKILIIYINVQNYKFGVS